MSLLFLTLDNFNIIKGETGSLLCNNINGFLLVLFYSTQCSYCQNVIPLFKQLPKQIKGCKFGMLNVSKNNQLVVMSKETIAPLEYVPYIILYTDGKPFMCYEGNISLQDLKTFILDIQQKLKHKEKFTPNVKKVTTIPSYTLGKPLCGENKRCYLEFDNAYIKT